jgi:hypothetical protein
MPSKIELNKALQDSETARKMLANDLGRYEEALNRAYLKLAALSRPWYVHLWRALTRR